MTTRTIVDIIQTIKEKNMTADQRCCRFSLSEVFSLFSISYDFMLQWQRY
nr:MAG TPA: hypothetical protein [Caudoviricetes sp.]